MKCLIACLLSLSVLCFSSVYSKDRIVSPAKDLSVIDYPELPLPLGFGFWYFGQEQDYVVTGLRATAFGFPIPGFDGNAISRIESRVDQFNFKGDYWIFPWLNVHGIIGTASGEATASLSPALRLGFGLNDFSVDYDAVVYGGGVTVAAGHKQFFGTVTTDYTWGDVDMEDRAGLTLIDPNGIETLVITPKVGVRGKRGAIWAGAYYQFTQHNQGGTFILPGPLPVDFEANVEDKSPWTPVIGGEYSFNENWSLTVEYGFGNDRRQGLVGVTRRF